MTTILVVDDHPLFREGLVGLLRTIDGMEVAGAVGDGETAIELSARLRPDVVFMDLNLPGMSGIEATRRTLAAAPETAVLIMTMVDDDTTVVAALRAGARGYLLKGADQDDIVRAIAAVGSGEAIFGPDIAKRVIEYFTVPRASHAAQAFPELTEREREVLELVAQGHNNAWMARHFVLSQKTIRNHVSNIFTKLQVADRAQAIVRAREAGMGQQSAKP